MRCKAKRYREGSCRIDFLTPCKDADPDIPIQRIFLGREIELICPPKNRELRRPFRPGFWAIHTKRKDVALLIVIAVVIFFGIILAIGLSLEAGARPKEAKARLAGLAAAIVDDIRLLK
jgi:hypothetical protein